MSQAPNVRPLTAAPDALLHALGMASPYDLTSPSPPAGGLRLPAQTAVRGNAAEAVVAPVAQPAAEIGGSGFTATLRNGATYVQMGSTNDFVPSRFVTYIPSANRDARGGYSDDDVRTGGVQLLGTRTAGDRQVVFSVQGEMLTEDGGLESALRRDGLHTRRVDVLDAMVDFNRRERRGDGSLLFFGYGAGIQVRGDLGGRELQDQIHQHIIRGRTGFQLQRDYTEPGVKVAPVVSAAVGGEKPLYDSGRLRMMATGSARANLALDRSGLSTLQARAGLATTLKDVGTLSAGLTMSRAFSPGNTMHFLPINRTYVGGEARVEIDYLEKKLGLPVHVIGAVQTRGQLGETTLYLGLAYAFGGKGEKPFLDPLR